MHGDHSERETTEVDWRHVPAEGIAPPIVETVPYVECKLEHSGLEPTRFSDSFFPAAVPYAFEGTTRVFYWQPSLEAEVEGLNGGVCATTDRLLVVDDLPASLDSALVARDDTGIELTVEGTIAGDTTIGLVRSYRVPTIAIRALSGKECTLSVDGDHRQLQAGTRTLLQLPEQFVEPAAINVDPGSVRPELHVRFPGERELHHPAVGATYRLFPSFGLDLDAVPNPVSVPTRSDELDHERLATRLGVSLSERPYPERVLWQAFAYTSFDPHQSGQSRLAQLPTGHLVVPDPEVDER